MLTGEFRIIQLQWEESAAKSNANRMTLLIFLSGEGMILPILTDSVQPAFSIKRMWLI